MPYEAMRIGRLLDPRDDDRWVTDGTSSFIEHDAMTYARKWAAEDRRSAIAVWKGNDVHCVLLAGLELKPIVE